MPEIISSVPLKPFTLISASQLKITQGGGCQSVFGIPFFLAGIFLSLIGLGVIKVENASEVPFWGWPLILSMGVIFTCVGGVLLFGRRWIIIDKSKGVISNIKGLIVPIKREDYSLVEFETVAIEYVAGDSDTSERYDVLFKRISGSDNLKLYSSTQYNETYERALFLAGFVRFTLEDNSSDHQTVLKPDELVSSLKKRLSRHADTLKQAYLPLDMKSRITNADGILQIEIPSKGFSYSNFIPLAIAVFVTWYFTENFLPFFKRTHTPELVADAFTGFVFIFFFLFPVFSFIKSVILSFRDAADIRIDDDEIAITFPEALRRKTLKIPVSDIIDMDYGTARGAKSKVMTSIRNRATDLDIRSDDMQKQNSTALKVAEYLSFFTKSKGILIKTKKDVIAFGQGLPDDDIIYIFSMMTKKLSDIHNL